MLEFDLLICTDGLDHGSFIRLQEHRRSAKVPSAVSERLVERGFPDPMENPWPLRSNDSIDSLGTVGSFRRAKVRTQGVLWTETNTEIAMAWHGATERCAVEFKHAVKKDRGFAGDRKNHVDRGPSHLSLKPLVMPVSKQRLSVRLQRYLIHINDTANETVQRLFDYLLIRNSNAMAIDLERGHTRPGGHDR
jgi:hypothetical protein